MKARYLTDYPLDGYLRTRRRAGVALRRDRFNLRPFLEAVGWVLAGAAAGSAAVALGAWGLLQLTESRAPPRSVTAMAYTLPQAAPLR